MTGRRGWATGKSETVGRFGRPTENTGGEGSRSKPRYASTNASKTGATNAKSAHSLGAAPDNYLPLFDGDPRCQYCGEDHTGLLFDCRGEFIEERGPLIGKVEITTELHNHIIGIASQLPVFKPVGGRPYADQDREALNLSELYTKCIEQILAQYYPDGGKADDKYVRFAICTSEQNIVATFQDKVRLPDYLTQTWGKRFI